MTQLFKYPNYAGSVAFVLIVFASYASWIVNAGSLDMANPGLPLAIGLGILYCIVGTVAFAWVDQLADRRTVWIAAYFLTQFVLGFGASFILKGINSITIMLIPLAWQSVLFRSRAALLVVNLLLCLGIVLLYGYLRPDWIEAWRMSATLIAGVVTAILFGQVTVREQDVRTEVVRLAADLQHKNMALQISAANAEKAAIAAERNRMAREIHDSLGHYLTAVAMQVQSARAMITSSGLAIQLPEVVDALRKAEGLSQEALTDIRRSVTALRETTVVQPSLPEALNDLCKASASDKSVGIHFSVEGVQRTLATQATLTLYRVAQEGITNIYKHAQASCAQIVLSYEHECVRLTVEDNGIGILSNDANIDGNLVSGRSDGDISAHTGFGLMGLRERVRLLGGTIKMKNCVEGGFMIEVEIPQ